MYWGRVGGKFLEEIGMKERFAQVLYWTGCVGGMVFGLWFVFALLVMINDLDIYAYPLLPLSLSLGSYGAGWAVRYVISGQK